MKKIIAIAVMAIALVSFNSFAFAGNSKNTAINPAGKTANANGKAYWKSQFNKQKRQRVQWQKKANECAENSTAQEQIIIELQDENSDLRDQIAALQAQLNTQSAPAPMLMDAPVQLDAVEAAPAESRKFAISKYADGNYGIYTNDFMLTDDAKEKLDSMVPGVYQIEVKVLNVETGIEVNIETETEAYDFNKTGYEWFIGKTING